MLCATQRDRNGDQNSFQVLEGLSKSRPIAGLDTNHLCDLLDGMIVGTHTQIRELGVLKFGDFAYSLVDHMRAPPSLKESLFNRSWTGI